jgi:hypothetical protein
MEETSLLQTNIDEGGLHTRQDSRYPPLIDVADEASSLISLKVELGEDRIFLDSNAGLKTGRVYDNFALHL